MRLRRRVRSKRVISIVMAFMISFCSMFVKPTKTFANEPTNNKRIERVQYNKSINIKRGTNNMKREMITINGKTYSARKMNMRCTAYTSAADEGGAYAYNGERLRDGHIAADFSVLPIGTKVYIPSLNKIYTVVDCGSAIKGNRLDIWMKTKWSANQFGIQNLEVYVLN